LCLENARQFEQDRIQKEHEKEHAHLKSCYEKNKDKIEQIREIIIQNSLEGKLEGTISIPLTFIQDEYNSEGKNIIDWFDHIGVKFSFGDDDFSYGPQMVSNHSNPFVSVLLRAVFLRYPGRYNVYTN
jgi:hypothetical protein